MLLNKLRSALTLLGMIIGVGAVITIVSLGEGLRRQFEGEMSSLGGDVFYMAPKSPKRPGQARRSPSLFTMDDMRAMEENCASIRAVFPGMDAPATVKHRNNTKRSHVQGVYDNFLVAFPNFKLERGRFFTKAELHARARVLVIGDGIADDLFEDAGDPV